MDMNEMRGRYSGTTSSSVRSDSVQYLANVTGFIIISCSCLSINPSLLRIRKSVDFSFPYFFADLKYNILHT